MRVTVRSVSLDPHPSELPDDREGFSVLLTARVGPADGPGDETVTIEVCTPEHLASRCRAESYVWASSLIVVDYDRFDVRSLEAIVRKRLERIEGATWRQIGDRFRGIGHWEFEDYDE